MVLKRIDNKRIKRLNQKSLFSHLVYRRKGRVEVRGGDPGPPYTTLNPRRSLPLVRGPETSDTGV